MMQCFQDSFPNETKAYFDISFHVIIIRIQEIKTIFKTKSRRPVIAEFETLDRWGADRKRLISTTTAWPRPNPGHTRRPRRRKFDPGPEQAVPGRVVAAGQAKVTSVAAGGPGPRPRSRQSQRAPAKATSVLPIHSGNLQHAR